MDHFLGHAFKKSVFYKFKKYTKVLNICKTQNINLKHLSRETHYNSSSPGVKQEDGTDQEGAGQNNAYRQEKPVAQANVLLPEQEWVPVWVAGQALTAVVAADGTDTLDGLHELWRLAESVEVEGKLCIFDGLGCRNCR